MSAERARDMTDRPATANRVHSNEESFRSPEDISDPSTRRDESKTGVIAWAKENKRYAFLWSSLLGIGALVGLFLFIQFAPGVLSHPYVWRGLVVLTIFSAGAYWAVKRVLGVLRRAEWVVLKYPDGVQVFFSDDFDGATDTFVPVKGFTITGNFADPFSVEDIGDQYVQHATRKGQEKDDPARIKLYPNVYTRDKTWIGAITVQNVSDLEPAPKQQNIDWIAKPSPEGHDEDIEALLEHLESLERTIQSKNARIDDLREQKEQLQIELRQSHGEKREEIIDTIERTAVAFRGQGNSAEQEDRTNGSDTISTIDKMVNGNEQ